MKKWGEEKWTLGVIAMALPAQSHSSPTSQLPFLQRLTLNNLPPIMSKLLAKCAQNIEKGSRANFGHYAEQIGAGWGSDVETNYISKQQRHLKSSGRRQEKERKERFVTFSENRRFLFTPPNGCEHFLNIARGGWIRKVKGLEVIVMAPHPSRLINKISLGWMEIERKEKWKKKVKVLAKKSKWKWQKRQ